MSNFDPVALAQIIEGGGVSYRENSVAFIFTCPRCDKKDKLYIRKRDGRFVCWRCKETDNFQGRAEWALRELYSLRIADIQAKLYGTDIPEQIEELVLEFDDLWDDMEEETFSVEEESPICSLEWPPDFFGFGAPAFEKGRQYLHSRGITDELIQRYDLKYCPSEKRVIFPVKVDGMLVGWQARYIDNTSGFNEETGKSFEIPKILTSASLQNKCGRFLMFQDNLIDAKDCLLAEGPVSAIKGHLCGGNTASMGKAVSRRQLEIIRARTRKLYLALDPDAAEEISRISEELYDDMEIYLVEPPPGLDDIGAATPEQVLAQKEKAPRINRGTLFISLGSDLAY